MEIAVENVKSTSKTENAMETLFSYLDKGIDDLEAGRMHTADEAFRIIDDRIRNEL